MDADSQSLAGKIKSLKQVLEKFEQPKQDDKTNLSLNFLRNQPQKKSAPLLLTQKDKEGEGKDIELVSLSKRTISEHRKKFYAELTSLKTSISTYQNYVNQVKESQSLEQVDFKKFKESKSNTVASINLLTQLEKSLSSLSQNFNLVFDRRKYVLERCKFITKKLSLYIDTSKDVELDILHLTVAGKTLVLDIFLDSRGLVTKLELVHESPNCVTFGEILQLNLDNLDMLNFETNLSDLAKIDQLDLSQQTLLFDQIAQFYDQTLQLGNLLELERTTFLSTFIYLVHPKMNLNMQPTEFTCNVVKYSNRAQLYMQFNEQRKDNEQSIRFEVQVVPKLLVYDQVFTCLNEGLEFKDEDADIQHTQSFVLGLVERTLKSQNVFKKGEQLDTSLNSSFVATHYFSDSSIHYQFKLSDPLPSAERIGTKILPRFPTTASTLLQQVELLKRQTLFNSLLQSCFEKDSSTNQAAQSADPYVIVSISSTTSLFTVQLQVEDTRKNEPLEFSVTVDANSNLTLSSDWVSDKDSLQKAILESQHLPTALYQFLQ